DIQFLVNVADGVSTTENCSYDEGLGIEACKMWHAKEVAGDLNKSLQKDKDIGAIGNTIDELNAIEETGYSGEIDLKETLVGLDKKMQ
ncbi:replicative DNA helicase, partial [Bacillus pseudomycoides]|nr:replicative DNA helicase [Bacillus pseudomycoides]